MSTDPPLSAAPRPTATPSVIAAAKAISPEVWHQPYKEGRGPIHWATGPATAKDLRQRALRWRRMAIHAELIAGWLEYMGDDQREYPL